MEVLIIVVYVALCVLIGFIGDKLEIGWAWAFFISFLFSPLIGFLVVAFSDRKHEMNTDMDAMYYSEDDFNTISPQSNEIINKPKFLSLENPRLLAIIPLAFIIYKLVTAPSSFYDTDFLGTYLVLHVLPTIAFIISFVWGKRYSIVRFAAYALCIIAFLIGLLSILITLFFGEDGLFLMITLVLTSAGVIYMTATRQENMTV